MLKTIYVLTFEKLRKETCFLDAMTPYTAVIISKIIDRFSNGPKPNTLIKTIKIQNPVSWIMEIVFNDF